MTLTPKERDRRLKERNKEYYKKYYALHRDRLIKSNTERIKSDPEKYKRYKDRQKEYQKNYKKKVPMKYICITKKNSKLIYTLLLKVEKLHEWRDRNKETVRKISKKYRDKNKDKIREKQKEKYKENINFIREQGRMRRKTEKYRERYEKYKKSEKRILGNKSVKYRRKQKIKTSDDGTITPEFIRNLEIIQKGECKGCKEKLYKKGIKNYHLDHIIPISKGGLHTASNIQLLCKDCNFKKRNYLPDDLFFK